MTMREGGVRRPEEMATSFRSRSIWHFIEWEERRGWKWRQRIRIVLEVFGSGRREADGRSAEGAAARSGERRGSTDLLREGYWRVLEERRGAEVGRTAALGALPIHRHGGESFCLGQRI